MSDARPSTASSCAGTARRVTVTLTSGRAEAEETGLTMKIIEDPSDSDDNSPSFELPTAVWIIIVLAFLAGALAFIAWLG